MARAWVHGVKFDPGMGPGDADGNPIGLTISVYDFPSGQDITAFQRITKANAATWTQVTLRTAVINAIIAAYAARGITITAVDIINPESL